MLNYLEEENAMTKFILALMVVLGCLNIGLAQSGKKATAQEKKDILQLISKDADFKDYKADELAQGFTAKKVDLNKDGQPEYIATLGGNLCGANANCPTWVLGKTSSEYKSLYHGNGRQLIVEKGSTNKYRNLRVEAAGTAILSYRTIYAFDGSMYKENQCFEFQSSGKKTKKVSVQCQ